MPDFVNPVSKSGGNENAGNIPVQVIFTACDSSWRPRRIANKVYGMNPSKENNDAKQDTDSEKPRLVPADLDIPDEDEEKHEETDLPPAMPPKV